MEYCDEGTLEEVSRLGLQEHVIRLYSKQITTAINVLHEHGIVHRDIKGEWVRLSAHTDALKRWKRGDGATSQA